jgi:hypothetical protein
MNIPNVYVNVLVNGKYLYVFAGKEYDNNIEKYNSFDAIKKAKKSEKAYLSKYIHGERFLGGNIDDFYDQSIDYSTEKKDIGLSDIIADINITKSISSGGREVFYVPIRIYYDDNCRVIKEKIENYCRIPRIYQSIADASGTCLDITHNGKKFKVQSKGNESTDYSTELNEYEIPVYDSNTPIILVTTFDLLDDLSTASDAEIEEYYEKYIRYYWPSITSIVFNEKIQGKDIINVQKIQFDDNIDKIYDITNEDMEKKHYFEPSELISSKGTSKIYFKNDIDIAFIFDQYKLDKEKFIIAKFDESTIYMRYMKRPVITKKMIPHQAGAIFIDNVLITSRFILGNDSGIIKKIVALTEDKVIVKQRETYNYSFNVNTAYKIDYKTFASLLKTYGSDRISFDTEYYSRSNMITFLYTKVHLDDSDGILMNIGGQFYVNCTMDGLQSHDDAIKIYRFMNRIFYIYFQIDRDNNSNVSISSGLKLKEIDPILFDYNKLFGTDETLYSRICQKNKQPIVFYKGSTYAKKYIKEKGIKSVELPNYTYPDITMEYVCPNKKYDHLRFLDPNYHPQKLSIPCCGVYTHENTGNRISNIYYIKKFDENSKPNDKKMSYLPQILDEYYNEKTQKNGLYLYGIKSDTLRDVINEIVGTKYETNVKSSLMRKLIKKNILMTIFEYNTGDALLKLWSIFTSASVVNNIEKMRMLFILHYGQYYVPIVYVVKDDKKYKQYFILENNSKLLNQTTYLYSKVMQTGVKMSNNVVQLYDTNDIVIKLGIMIGDKYIHVPVYPSYIDLDMPYKRYTWIKNNHILLAKYSGKTVSKVIKNTNGFYIGYEFDDGLTEFFEPVKSMTTTYDIKIINFDNTSTISEINMLDKSKIDIRYELYYLYLIHFGTYVNTIQDKTHMIKISDLIDEFTSTNDQRYKSDILLLNSGKKPIEYFKYQKNKIYKLIANGNKSDLLKYLTSISHKISVIDNSIEHDMTGNNRRKLCGTSNEYSLTNQCSNSKLIVDSKFYLNILCNELMYNSFKADIILNNRMSKMISINKFSEQKGTIVEKITL